MEPKDIVAVNWQPGDTFQALCRLKRPQVAKPEIIIHSDYLKDLITPSLKERKRYLKRKYLGKPEPELIQGELGVVDCGFKLIVSDKPLPTVLKFPTPTQVAHKRKKQRRARTGRR